MRNREKIIFAIISISILGNVAILCLNRLEWFAPLLVFELVSIPLMTLCMILDIYSDKASKWFDKR